MILAMTNCPRLRVRRHICQQVLYFFQRHNKILTTDLYVQDIIFITDFYEKDIMK
jgi:hypothetical protein